MLHKKANAGLIAIIIIILVIIFLGWLINLGTRDCNKNSDCGEEAYCSVEHECHQIPVIERSATTVINKEYTVPSLILGAAIILAALILKFEKLRPKKKQPEKPLSYY